MRALSNIQLLLVILRDNSIIILKLGCSTKEVIMSISARMIECPLCREKAQAVEDLSELRRVYTCPNCGRFEHYPLVASFDGFTPMMTHDIFQRVRKKSAQKENRNLKTVYRILAIQYN